VSFEPGRWIESVELGGAEQALDGGGASTGMLGTSRPVARRSVRPYV
jgi:hypothetical protein